MFNTMVLPQFIDYNGGMDYLNSQISEELTLKQAVGLMSFIPIINVICALILFWWLITCILNS